ncbi:MAG: CPBP family glutamic-type intramembrane protease [Akkermansia sp.]
MSKNQQSLNTRKTYSYVAPFVVFMGFMLILQMVLPAWSWDHPSAPWWQRYPAQWLYPLQTLTCLTLIILWRKNIHWDWKWRPSLLGILFGGIGILFWLLPVIVADRLSPNLNEYFGTPSWPWYKYILGIDYRLEGFNPSDAFTQGSFPWGTSLVMRFIRAVVVVAIVEELFWRGYLMRLLVNPDHPWKVPFGTHSWSAYWITTLCFVIVHNPVDYLAAFVYGTLAYILAVSTKNLTATIIMHATANLILGWSAMAWQKFGLW